MGDLLSLLIPGLAMWGSNYYQRGLEKDKLKNETGNILNSVDNKGQTISGTTNLGAMGQNAGNLASQAMGGYTPTQQDNNFGFSGNVADASPYSYDYKNPSQNQQAPEFFKADQKQETPADTASTSSNSSGDSSQNLLLKLLLTNAFDVVNNPDSVLSASTSGSSNSVTPQNTGSAQSAVDAVTNWQNALNNNLTTMNLVPTGSAQGIYNTPSLGTNLDWLNKNKGR